MKKKVVKRLLAGTLAGVLSVGMLAGCGGGDSSNETAEEDTSDKPDTWIADRTITVQAYVDDIGNTLPEDFQQHAYHAENHRADRYQTGCQIYTW